MNYLIKLISDTIVGIIASIGNKWMEMNESRKRGQAESINAGHDDALKRKKRSDEVMDEEIKTGQDLLDDIGDDLD